MSAQSNELEQWIGLARELGKDNFAPRAAAYDRDNEFPFANFEQSHNKTIRHEQPTFSSNRSSLQLTNRIQYQNDSISLEGVIKGGGSINKTFESKHVSKLCPGESEQIS